MCVLTHQAKHFTHVFKSQGNLVGRSIIFHIIQMQNLRLWEAKSCAQGHTSKAKLTLATPHPRV